MTNNIKKTVGVLALGIVFIIAISMYLRYDKIGYYIGFGCTFCDKNIPYNLNPSADRYYSFTLNDEDDFELIGTGFGYKNSSFIIKDFLAYGYNDTSVIVKCTDSLNIARYLVSYETAYKSKKGNPEISFKDLSISDFEQIKDKYQWFEVDEEKANTVRFMKFLFIIGALLSLFFIVKKIFKLRNNKATD